ncbi:tape measure protein [Mycobacterium phage Cosmo]|uniref:Tape measure protein n=1 Tax=Mycobacterium phage Cosmo TaxID=1567467 RepID=A0A0B5A360_9CAUD|nr:tape measure protein [Mycobacterium phage Cosmo]
MAVQYAGEAAIRIVPSLRNFRSRVQNELSRKPLRFDIDIRPNVDTTKAEAELERFRAKESADAINLRAKVDIREARQAFSQVQHIFKRSAVAKALRVNLVVLGGDAVYAAVGALGSLATAADVAGKSLFALPAAFASAGAAAGVFAASLMGIKEAFKALSDDQEDAAQNARELSNAQRDAEKAHRDVRRAIKDVGTAYRDARREVEDLHREVRRGSLTEAEALLDLQDAVDNLKNGSFKSLNEFRRAQLNVLKSYDSLQETQLRNTRNQEDLNQAQSEGIANNQRVVQALDAMSDAQQRVADSADRMAKATESKGDAALAKLAPEAQEFVLALKGAESEFMNFVRLIQGDVFRGQANNVIDTLRTSIKNLGPDIRGVAGEVNGVLQDLGASLRSPENQNLLKGVLGNTKSGLNTLRDGIDPLVNSLLRLSNTSGFTSLAGWLVTLIDRWDAFIERIDASGELDEWIQNGIQGLDNLLNTIINLGSFIANVADAWRAAGGDAQGVLGSAEKLTDRLAKWSESAQGKNSMINYFRDVRGFIDEIKDAFGDMRPLLASITQFVRDWSTVMLNLLGTAARLTEWVDEHTGLVKVLLWTWLSFRTIAPIWGMLQTGAKNYLKVVKGLGEAQVPVFRNMNNGLTTAKDNWKQMTGYQAGAHSTFQRSNILLTGQAAALRDNFDAQKKMLSQLQKTSPQIVAMGNAAKDATGKVGGGPAGVQAGLRGALGGIAAFIGPLAASIVATGGIMWAIDKLGEAHRNAARDADDQRAALENLKQTLDSTTGAFTQQTALESAKQAQSYSIPNFPGGGNRNVLSDFARTGLGTPQDLINAGNPTQQALRNDVLGKLDNQTRIRVEQSPEWARGRKFWEEHGVTSLVMAQAMNGDPSAVAKVQAAERQAFDPKGTGNLGDRTYQSAQRHRHGIEDLSAMISATGTYDFASSAIFIRDRAGALTQGGQAIQEANTAANGPVALKPGSTLGGPGARVYREGDTYKVETSGSVPPGWEQGVPSEIGQAIRLPDGRGQILLTPEAVKNNIAGYATGGLIRGVGSGTSDSNIVRASMGEFIVRKAAVDKYGVQTLNSINQGEMPRFDGGGIFAGPYDNPPPNPWAGVSAKGTTGVWTPPQQPGGSALLREAGKTASRLLLGSDPYPDWKPTVQLGPPTPQPDSGVDDWIAKQGLPQPKPAPIPTPTAPQNKTPAAQPTGTPVKAPNPSGQKTGTTPTATPTTHGSGTAGPGNTVTPPNGIPHGQGAATNLGGTGYTVPTTFGASVPAGAAAIPGSSYGLPAGSAISYGAEGFPDWVYTLGSQYGVEASTYAGHQERSGQNRGLDWRPKGIDVHTPEGAAIMDRFAQAMINTPGVEQVIWKNPFTGQMFGKDPGDRGANQSIEDYYRDDWAGHTDHVHIRTSQALGFPEGLNPQVLAQYQAQGLLPNLPGVGNLGAQQKQQPKSLLDLIVDKYRKAYEPEQIMQFLGDQAANVGRSLQGIGLQALQGFTGLDLSGVFGNASSIGSHFLGGGGDGETGSLEEGSALDQAITGNMDQFMAGNGALGVDIASLFGGQKPATKSQGEGVDQWDDTIFGVLMQLAQMGLINPSEIPDWMDAVKRQMKIESGGNPGAVNNWDSNAAKGTPSKGLMQMVEGTFNQHKVPGIGSGQWLDPVSQIAASVMYAKSKGGPSYMTGKQGYATGGMTPSDLIRVSRGEFRMQPKAVSKFGLGFMNALNAGQLPGFAEGGAPFLPFMPTPATPPPASGPTTPPAPGAQPHGPAPQAPGVPAPTPGPGVPPPGGPGVPPPGGPLPGPAPAELVGPNGELDPQQQALAEQLTRGLGAVGASQGNMGTGYLNPGITGAIEGGFNALGSAAGTAAALGISAGTMGAGAGPAAGAASQAISAGFQIAGKVASGAANILGAAGVGSIKDIGSQATPSGAPLLPVQTPETFGALPSQQQMQQAQNPQPAQAGPMIVNNYMGGIHTTNLDDFQRRQQRLMDQQGQPIISKYAI